MQLDTSAKLDNQAAAELAAERDRHARTVAALSHRDSTGLTREWDCYQANVNGIMATFLARTLTTPPARDGAARTGRGREVQPGVAE